MGFLVTAGCSRGYLKNEIIAEKLIFSIGYIRYGSSGLAGSLATGSWVRK